MSVGRFATHSPGRLEWHPAHDELAASDPETFSLHVKFLHAHGSPRAEFTTFSNVCVATGAAHDTDETRVD